MKRIAAFILLVMVMIRFGYATDKANIHVYISSQLSISKLSDHLYVHTSYLTLSNGTSVACNGIIYVNNNEAIVVDTPTTKKASLELIDWVKRELKSTVKVVVPTHFHVDCIGGLEAFHKNNIKSLASTQTIALIEDRDMAKLISGFENTVDINIGNETITIAFFGEGHTSDNVVSYIPSEKALFGGCLIKSIKANKGNLNDANTEAWSNTVRAIKTMYKDLELVVPGHGSSGGTELLDYTIELFN